MQNTHIYIYIYIHMYIVCQSLSVHVAYQLNNYVV